MIYSDDVFPVDFKAKRKAAGYTQARLADKWGVARETIVRVENGKQSISFPLALQGASEFGSLTLRMGNESFTILADGSTGPTNGGRSDDEIPNDEQLNDLDAAEHISNVRNRASDMVEATNLAERRWLAIRNGCTQGREHYIRCYAQAFSLKWAVDGFIEDGEKDRPHLVDQGRRIALGCRPGYEGGGGLEAA